MANTRSGERIQKITAKGQITLPAAWRRAAGTDHIALSADGKQITIRPARLEQQNNDAFTVFDALRDNNGKGLKVADLRKMVKQAEDNGSS